MRTLTVAAAFFSVAATTPAPVVTEPKTGAGFADAIFAIWLRDQPAEDTIRQQVVSRARDLLK